MLLAITVVPGAGGRLAIGVHRSPSLSVVGTVIGVESLDGAACRDLE